ncbi:MAG: outer membrane protein assembly factor BamC [Gammaproteobacteria bacterium]
MKKLKILTIFFLILSLNSCGIFSNSQKYDYLKEEKTEDLVIPSGSESKIVDYYPVPDEIEKITNSSYEVPLPRQVFSSGTTNQVRLHKLGELRWIYIESLPSTVWPVMKDFMTLSEQGLDLDDPEKGIMESNPFTSITGINSKLVLKVEHGIRQSSSEVFLSHLAQNNLGEWERVSVEENIEAEVLKKALDYLSSAPNTSGTSLIALNLNIGQKAILKSEKGIDFIEMNLNFSRAWAAVNRALNESLIEVKDLNREEGVFFVNFGVQEEMGFVRGLFSRNTKENRDFVIEVSKVNENKCLVKVISKSEESQEMARNLLSEINQSLS